MAKTSIDEPRITAYSMDPDDLTIIGIDTHHTRHGEVDDGTSHPLYDERIKIKLDPAKVANVVQYGVITPIQVRKEGDKIVVVNGRQRVRWAREANIKLKEAGGETHRIPVMEKRGDGKKMTGIMIVTNVVTEHESTMSKARKAQQYLDMNHSEEMVATTFGVSMQTVRNWIALLETAPEIQRMVEAGKIGAMAAAKLASLPHAEQIAKAKEQIESGDTSVTALARVAKGAKEEREGKQTTTYPLPRKRALKKLIDAWETGELPDLDPLVIKTIRWMTGSMMPTQIKGLSPALRKVAPPKEDAESDAE